MGSMPRRPQPAQRSSAPEVEGIRVVAEGDEVVVTTRSALRTELSIERRMTTEAARRLQYRFASAVIHAQRAADQLEGEHPGGEAA